MAGKTTIKDIAKSLGISPSTVSRALSNGPGVGGDLRKRIRKVASQLNYIPNSSAKSLRTRKTKTIGLIVSDIRNSFFLEFMGGVEAVLFPREFKFIVCNTGEDSKKEEIYIRWLMEHGVEGILSSPYQDREGSNNGAFYKKAMKSGIHVVFYDRLLEGVGGIDSVTLDNEQAIMNGVFYLRERGHERIALCLHKRGIYTIEERYSGFKKACAILGIHPDDRWVLEDMTDYSVSLDKLRSVLTASDRPTAVISTNQYLNETVVRAARELGLDIPADLSLVGFDDSSLNELIDPPVTTIRQPVVDMGKIAATLLLGRIDGDRGEQTRIVLKAELLERNSVASTAKIVKRL